MGCISCVLPDIQAGATNAADEITAVAEKCTLADEDDAQAENDNEEPYDVIHAESVPGEQEEKM
jgi:hypothetical protein